MSYTITIQGDEEAIRKLAGLDPECIAGEPLRKAAEAMVGRLAVYPLPPSGSTYRRTGTLGRAWTQQGAGLRYVVGNNVRYATYVQGEDQARVHQGRWLTAEKAAMEEAATLALGIAAAVEAAFGG